MHNARGGCNNLLHLGLGRGEGAEGEGQRGDCRGERIVCHGLQSRFQARVPRYRAGERKREKEREREIVGVKRCWNVRLLFSLVAGNVKFSSHWILLFLAAFVMENIKFFSRLSISCVYPAPDSPLLRPANIPVAPRSLRSSLSFLVDPRI